MLPWSTLPLTAMLFSTCVTSQPANAIIGDSGTPIISEIRIDQAGPDNDEYFEITAPPGTVLDGLTYIVIGDGSSSSGVVELVVDLAGVTVPDDGVLLVGESSMTLAVPDVVTSLNFENSDNLTHMLVAQFTGSAGDDLDADDDCELDAMPWSELVDAVALVEDAAVPPSGTECHYGPPTIGPDEDGAVPFHAWRCVEDQEASWNIGSADLQVSGDTPGAPNAPCGPGPCDTVADCADLDGDGAPDDPCLWTDCATNSCASVPREFGDVGGEFGDCAVDGFVNLHDRNLVLHCFSRSGTCADLNMDIGGAFGDCAPDGHCNIHDVIHISAASAGIPRCVCPDTPAPEIEPQPHGVVELRLKSRGAIYPGALGVVDVWVSSETTIHGIQVVPRVSGGLGGQMRWVKTSIRNHPQDLWHLDPEAYSAFDPMSGAVLRGSSSRKPTGPEPRYLATFYFEPTGNASGNFVVDVAPGDNATAVVDLALNPADVQVRPAVLEFARPQARSWEE
jgi:hypothetical protein